MFVSFIFRVHEMCFFSSKCVYSFFTHFPCYTYSGSVFFSFEHNNWWYNRLQQTRSFPSELWTYSLYLRLCPFDCIMRSLSNKFVLFSFNFLTWIVSLISSFHVFGFVSSSFGCLQPTVLCKIHNNNDPTGWMSAARSITLLKWTPKFPVTPLLAITRCVKK